MRLLSSHVTRVLRWPPCAVSASRSASRQRSRAVSARSVPVGSARTHASASREQSAHLVEQHPGRRTGRLEGLDPLEPGEDRARFVHVPTVAARDAPLRDEFVTMLQLAIDCTAK